ncbi:S1C family serine protease [Pleionea sediminis]|uniref:S1C family serine protease n=1 Tax=Pleionea sediminis TaxID=2569479 RepID=UPI001186F76F|nr:trypsin-like peptidase domain-containing protein [Pleionea sediminis]
MVFWIKYISAGLLAAFFYLLIISDSQASIDLRKWLANRLVHSVEEQQKPIVNHRPFADQSTYADAIAASAPSVVSIQTVGKGKLSKNPNPTSIEDKYLVNVGLNVGSGVIIDSRGYVVTNYHVVHDAESIKVQLSDGRQKIATLIGSDRDTDIALLHVDLDNLPTPKINNERKVNTGDVVFAIGTPYGYFDQTVTMGIISATRLTTADFPIYQIDAAIHPGNSGGALINAYGEVIGITSQQLAARGQGAAQTGISFSIPFPVVQEIASDLLDDGKVSRKWLGFSATQLSQRGHDLYAPNEIEYGQGFAVTSIDKNGPADKAGLQFGDYVSHINDQPITSIEQVYRVVSQSKLNDQLTLRVYRDKSRMKVIITVAKYPKSAQ